MASDDEHDSDGGALLPTSVLVSRHEQERKLHTTYRPRLTIDWRAEILRILDIPHAIPDDKLLEAMSQAYEKLRSVDHLRAMAQTKQGPPRLQVIHRVHCQLSGMRMYLDQPWIMEKGDYLHLRTSPPLTNLERFLDSNKDIAFIVYREYKCCDSSKILPHGEQKEFDAVDLLQSECIHFLADDLKTAWAIISLTASMSAPQSDVTIIDKEEPDRGELCHPYMWYFHGRREIEQATDELPLVQQRYIHLLHSYIQDRMSADWDSVDALLEEGMISTKHIRYLFVPGQIVVSQQNGTGLSQIEAFVTRDWLQETTELRLHVGSWKFDGRFLKSKTTLVIDGLPSSERKFNITDLAVFPVRFATEEVVKALRNRGRIFWECRTRKYVSYIKADAADGTMPRYMIDMATYKLFKGIHSDKELQASLAEGGANIDYELESDHILYDDPDLGDDFFMCLPASIPGWEMQTRQWTNLYVHFIKDVVWNTEAFDDLVIDPGTKTIVQALVTDYIRGEDTNLISGKGNSLFILLHGEPGTGKTLTAESAAELAKRPLYGINCTDIGTDAEEVETNLKSALGRASAWGAVVLLDEADVFLEQRSPDSLKRNALVSVFLRELEYYEGILIFTSNRMRTLDEAFKSRIHLNLRFRALDEDQRLQIWKAFLKRLGGFGTHCLAGNAQSCGLNMEELIVEVEALARVELTGRQIRNAILTARSLASYLGEPLGISHIKSVVRQMAEFDEDHQKSLHRFRGVR